MMYSKELRNVYIDEVNAIVAKLSDLLDACEEEAILTSEEFGALYDAFNTLENLASDLQDDTFLDDDNIVC